MSIIGVIVVMALLGAALWSVVAFIPMYPAVKRALIAVVLLGMALWLLSMTGILNQITDVKLPQLD